MENARGVDSGRGCRQSRYTTIGAVEWIRAGGDTFSLQTLLGHTSQTMSRIYVQLADTDMMEKHARLSLVERITKRRR